MSKPFDMELFLVSVLTGSYSTRQRHICQAKTIQTAIAERWSRDNPWTWRRKHIAWFLANKRSDRCEATWNYYKITIKLTIKRLEKQNAFKNIP
ncbi:hypothetical protein SJI00_16440 [Pseudomonas sp. RP23018S]|uniref:hypothetical protein n=1 Tax=Pseudomonas sp. RP23018S TaxID=3096037 RepID=UPI002ACB01FE|nr:hypothetical protein [Pseudomonas sp. RP23018S]MDZ5604363.1 hypothetical protein [Pseudomonas sp. RP23018S]